MLAGGRPISVDVFGIAGQPGGAFLRDAAIAAGCDLGVFELLRARARSLPELAGALGLPSAHRVRALVEVLAALGVVDAHRGAGTTTYTAAAAPPRPEVAPAGWGLLADVIRRDRPLAVTGEDPADSARRYHHHLATAGAASAAELVGQLGASSLLDLGAGAGAYSKAFLEAHPAATATLVDTAEVLGLAAAWLGPLAGRARLVAGDAAEVDAGGGHGAALLANVLHLHPPGRCAELCAAAARAVAPGGVVAIKDLRVDEDRAGPLAGLLFALNMAIYTEAGEVYPASQLRAWLEAAGLVDLRELRLAAAPDAIVVVGRRPAARARGHGAAERADAGGTAKRDAQDAPDAHDGPDARDAHAPHHEPGAHGAIARELRAALARTARSAWEALAGAGALRAEARAAPPRLAFPRHLERFLAAAIASERGAGGRAQDLARHYTDAMPRLRVAQLASTAEPGATLFHTPLDGARLPRLAAALGRLFALLEEAGVSADDALGARSVETFFARTPTLAALYERTQYGGCMPLLYGTPADLAYVHARCVAGGGDVVAAIDRYLTAPIVHELCHLGRDRTSLGSPHLDECVAGWLGAHVHPALVYPGDEHEAETDEHNDALYAAPWLAQVGQAFARAFGVARIVRAHAGELTALPADVVAAAARLGWDDWRARRTLHFLSDTFDPAPWVALALAGGSGRSLEGATVASLAALPLATLELPADEAFDRAIVEDALRAMCLSSAQVAGSFRTRACLPDEPVAIDAGACAILAGRRGPLDPVVPRSWLPPAVASRISARGLVGYALRLGTLAAIPEAAAAICDGSPGCERDGFALVPRVA